jgi:protein involved in polysaccharide export with SLBB domain
LTQQAPEKASPVPTAPGPKDTIIQIGDVLEIAVAEDRSFNGRYEVRRGGYIILPAVGRIEAAGLPLKEVQANVSKSLEETQLPHATVNVEKMRETHGGREL